MHILMYRREGKDAYCSVMGIFFTKKGAKKARNALIAHDRQKYPRYEWRSEQTKSCYSITEHQPFKVKKHKDPFEAK